MNILEKAITVTPDSLIKIFLVTSTEEFSVHDCNVQEQTKYIPFPIPHNVEEFTLFDVLMEYRKVENLEEIFVIDDLPLQGKIYKIEKNGSACEYATTRGYA